MRALIEDEWPDLVHKLPPKDRLLMKSKHPGAPQR
jgi:hypothetical protein